MGMNLGFYGKYQTPNNEVGSFLIWDGTGNFIYFTLIIYGKELCNI